MNSVFAGILNTESMSLLQLLGWVGVVLAPISGIIVAIIVDRRSKRTGEKSNEVAMATVEVSEKEAYNHEMAIIIEGFNLSMENLRRDVEVARSDAAQAHNEAKGAREESRILREELGLLREANSQLTQAHNTLHAQVQERVLLEREMLHHIQFLEGQVPTPPGPPTRPVWHLTPGVR